MKIVLEAQIKNGLLFEAVKKLGSQSALARYLGVAPAEIGNWLRFKKVPKFRLNINKARAKTYARWDKLLIELIGATLEDVFPVELESAEFLAIEKRIEHFMEMPPEVLAAGGFMPQLPPAPDEIIFTDSAHKEIFNQLETLTPREEKVIKMRFGLMPDGVEYSLEEIAQLFAVTRERVRQVEAKALRKLRHPSRSRELKPYLK